MKRSKYGNVRTHGFHSKAEYARYLELKLLEKAGEITCLRTQEPYVIKINGIRICEYRSDFYYMTDLGPVVEDVKGVRTDVYRIKRKLMLAVLGIDVKEVRAKDLKIRRKP